MVIEMMYTPDKLVSQIARYAKTKCIDEGMYDDNIAYILTAVLDCHINLNPKIRSLCEIIVNDLDSLIFEKDDSIAAFDQSKIGQRLINEDSSN